MLLNIRRGMGALLAVAVAALAGCGGGGSASVAVSGGVVSINVPQTQARVQPASAVQEVSPLQLRTQSAGVVPRATRIELGPLAQTQSQPAEAGPGRALQIGQSRAIAQTSSAAATLGQFQWQSTADGGQVGAISFSAQGAHGLRLGVLVRQLPGGAILRVYSQSRPGEVYQIAGLQVLQRIDANLAAGDSSDEARTWWTPYLGQDDATLEIELPPGTPVRSLDIAVPRLSQLTVDLRALQASGDPQTQVGESAYCQLDANCYNDLVDERDAVARMIYVKNGGSYLCTGTLLNDRESTGTPHFISANHCIASQSVASSLQTDWFYRSATCSSSSVASAWRQRFGGATLLFTQGSTDTSFMRLNEAPPAGALFAGWTSGPVSLNDTVASVHHPKGDLLKYARGGITGFYHCNVGTGATFSCTPGSSGDSSHYDTTYSQGLTEGGSSGSGLFKNAQLVGVLSGGTSSCTASAGGNYGMYGRFDLAYAAGIKQWLWASGGGGGGGGGTDSRSAVYRFFNSTTGAHFYTSSAGEHDFVIATYPVFRFEGTAFYAYTGQAASTSPVYRFFNRQTGAHFYTISAAERDYVIATYPVFTYEGPSWFAQPAPGGSATAMYRFFNTQSGAHFYTISAAERDNVIVSYPVFKYEGPAYYAWTTP